MSTRSGLVTGIVVRSVLPLTLLPCILVRPSLFSFVYMLMFLCVPFLSLPTTGSPGQRKKGRLLGPFARTCLILSFSTVICQIVCQVVLLAIPPYGQVIKECSLLEVILRHIGLIRLNGLQWTELFRWLGPDALALAATLVTYLLLTAPSEPPPGEASGTVLRSNGNKNRGWKFLSSVGPYAVLAGLCVTSALQPSLCSALYYVVFLLGATWWALCRQLRNKFFAGVFGLTAVFLCFHVTALYVYQTEWGQSVLEAQSLFARLFGLVPIFITTGSACALNESGSDPRVSVFNRELDWTSYTSPALLLALFHVLVYQVKDLLHAPATAATGPGAAQAAGGAKRTKLMTFGTSQEGRSNRRRSKDRVSIVPAGGPGGDAGSFQVTETKNEVLSRSGDEGAHARLKRKSSASLRSSRGPDNYGCSGGDGWEDDGYADGDGSDAGLLFSGLLTLFGLFSKSSYVATNIIMMAWSITYHSWSTFVLLLWACVLWMFPNQRRAMLLSSPGLVVYAELLLLAQYVSTLDLTSIELPTELDWLGSLADIGFVRSRGEAAALPILVKSLYTGMFWITLRQFVMERREQKLLRATASLVTEEHEPFRSLTSELARPHAASTTDVGGGRGGGGMLKLGSFIKRLLTKFWIWVVAIMLFVIGLGGEKVVLYRIVYMALGLIFILTFQLSYRVWRRLMYGFWLSVIVYSMLVLVSIYIYQFQNIPGLLSNYTHIPPQLQSDIGLERYDTGSLFVRLLTPTFFVVITVIQLHYFHSEFLLLSEMTRRNTDPYGAKSRGGSEPPAQPPPRPLVDDLNWTNLWIHLVYYATVAWECVVRIGSQASTIGWRFLEIHIMKIVLLSAYLLTVQDSGALHLLLYMGVVAALSLASRPSVQRLLTHLCSIYISALLLAKMIYQIDYIDHTQWDRNCSELFVNTSNSSSVRNDAEWLGLTKTNHLTHLLQGYIGMILVLTIQAVVHIRQSYERYMSRSSEPIVGVLFPQATRADADRSLIKALKFLLSYGFYKFGVELSLVTLVVVIGTRMDLFSVLYGLWLIPMFRLGRSRLDTIWTPFVAFVAVLLPVQYLAAVGLPPFLCSEYPWEAWPYFNDEELQEWLFLPSFITPPQATRLIPDFFLLLFGTCQLNVFRTEREQQLGGRVVCFGGGSNTELADEILSTSLNPVPDFLTRTKSWLDVVKKCIFLSFYWLSLAIMFLSGTNRVNLFALGYLIGSFIFLWEGNEFYLRTRRQIIQRWNWLLSFNVFVILCKSVLQLVGCVFFATLPCWIVQLLGVACLKFGPNTGIGTNSICREPQNEAGLMWDTITFVFLLFQRKIFNSHYFAHIRAETQAQALLASRGAELIGELMQKQISEQAEEEKDVLEKIKTKMDRIKATHQKGRPKENHFDASSLVSSALSLEEDLLQESLPPPPHLAPLAPQISIGTSAPTPTPSSAANTISVEGFFEPPYGRRQRDSYYVLQPPRLPLSPSDESFPVFSPPPYGTYATRSVKEAGSGTTGGVGRQQIGVQTSPKYYQYNSYYQTSPSPALSHHTSIRSGDYYMFEDPDEEDEEMEMIDSIVEENEDSRDEDEDFGPSGVTVSELMASALKSGDVDAAAEMARLARRSSFDQGTQGGLGGSLTESTGGGPGTQQQLLQRRRTSSKRRLTRKKSATGHSIKSRDKYASRGVQPAGAGGPDDPTAPLAALSDEGEGHEHEVGSGEEPEDRHPPDGDPGDEGPSTLAQVQPPQPPPAPQPTLLRRILGYIRFAWAFLESLMTSASNYLNKFSRDYRLVARTLAAEKQILKERGDAVHRVGEEEEQLRKQLLQSLQAPPPQPPPPPAVSTADVELGLLVDLVPGSEEAGGTGVWVDGQPVPSQVTHPQAGKSDDLVIDLEHPPMDDSMRTVEDGDDMSSSVVVGGSCTSEESAPPTAAPSYPPLLHLLIALWYVLISHSDLVCYFLIFLNQMNSASLLSLPLPLLVLLWGSLSVPRPTKTFWVTIIAYTEAIVVIKYLFQFDFFPWNETTLEGGTTGATPTKSDPFTPTKILGIEKHGKYAAYDVSLLMVVFFHRFMLKSLGLWKNKSRSAESSVHSEEGKGPQNPVQLKPTPNHQIQPAKEPEQLLSGPEVVPAGNGERRRIGPDGDGGSESGSSAGSSQSPQEEDSSESVGCLPGNVHIHVSYDPTILKLCVVQYLSSIQTFFQQILNLDYKVKVDVYSYMFMCDFFNFLVVIFGFSAFGSSQQADVSSYLEENKVPVPFLVMVILQFGLIVIDRALYLRKYIMAKFFYQIFLVTFVHSAMFFALPAVTERDFGTSTAPQLWYIVKCIYLLFSAYQIRSGYPTRILGNFLCKKYNYVNMFLFKGFMAVPFLFELRALMDWIWTDTSMTLSDWLKLEDIFAHVFQLKCQRRVEKEYPQGRGTPKARWSKYAIGGSSLFIIIAIIWFPLVLFALGNTVGLPNPPKEMAITITIGSYQPIFTMSAQNHSLKSFSTRDWTAFLSSYRGEKEALYFLNNYESEDSVAAQFNGNSDAVWGISPPARTALIEDLKSSNPISIRFSWTVLRESPSPTGATGAKDKREIYLDSGDPSRQRLIDMISGNTSAPVLVKHLFPKFLKISNSGKATSADKMKKGGNEGYVFRNLRLSLKREGGGNESVVGGGGPQVEWWDVEEVCNPAFEPLPLDDHCKPGTEDHLNMYTFNEKSFPPTLSFISGGGIIGLYTTLVLVASKFVRSFFAGISFLIMFDDMPNVDRIFQLCLDIYLVRESGELALEEDLFAKLIFLYRSPETLIKWTRPKKIPQPQVQHPDQPHPEDTQPPAPPQPQPSRT